MSTHLRRPLALVLAAALLVGGAWAVRALVGAPPPAFADSEDSRIEASFLSTSELERLLGAYEQRTSEVSTPSDYLALGNLQLEAGRTSGSVEWYTAAGGSFRSADELVPADPRPQVGLARVALALHDFDAALAHAAAADERQSGRLDVRAVRADALMAVGQLDAASAELERLARIAPDAPSVLVRRSQAAWLAGRIDLARSLAVEAVDVGDQNHARRAWYAGFAAQMAFDTGDIETAETFANTAVQADPSAITGLVVSARVAAGQGEFAAAIDFYERAIANVPEPRAASELAVVYRAAGRIVDAERTEDLVEVVAAVAEGVFDRDLARYLADRDPLRALALAEASMQGRMDPDGWAVLAWAAYRVGDLSLADQASAAALATGYRHAEVLYQAGVIAEAVGADPQPYFVRALETNPYFHPVHGPRVRQLLDEHAP
ncbi:MAG: tetratricopeptide repeat protein [Acidimicrobiia bacterium]